MDITAIETPELIEMLQEIPTSLLLRLAYERVIDISRRTDNDEVAEQCEVIAEEIHEVVRYFDIEEAKELIAYRNKAIDAAKRRS